MVTALDFAPIRPLVVVAGKIPNDTVGLTAPKGTVAGCFFNPIVNLVAVPVQDLKLNRYDALAVDFDAHRAVSVYPKPQAGGGGRAIIREDQGDRKHVVRVTSFNGDVHQMEGGRTGLQGRSLR